MLDRVIRVSIFLLWIAVVTIYPMLISIYVTMPLFIGFAGLMFIDGIDEDNYWKVIFSLVYIINLEVNLSLPLLLVVISIIIFYFFIKSRLSFLKLCSICINVVTVLSINVIYFALLYGYDFLNNENSVNYDSLLLFSILYDTIAAVLI
jgi:hypothetical protein